MLEFVHGDMFDHAADIRVNTVNCVGVMGAGVALAFKRRYPEMFKAYQRDCRRGLVMPGKMHIWRPLDDDWVINFPTKRDWRDPSRYEDIEAGLEDLHSYLDSVGPVTVCLPALGCGHGGLDWERVSPMIRDKLGDLNARILVFEPADSRRAGRAAADEPTDSELTELTELGFARLPQALAEQFGGEAPLFAKGGLVEHLDRWMALLPSKAPSPRELAALRAIANELGHQKFSVPIALVYASKVSEEIAEIFLREGLKILFLLPFGVLTRKSIATLPLRASKDEIGLISNAAPSEKWNRVKVAETAELLRRHAAGVLLSDPDPEWIIGKAGLRWKGTPLSFVRYEQAADQVREKLQELGASAIARKGDSGIPNLDVLLAAFRRGNGESDWNAGNDLITLKTKTTVSPTDLVIDLLEHSPERRAELLGLVARCNPTSLHLNASGIDDTLMVALEEWISRTGDPIRP